MTTLVIDIGSSSVRALLFDTNLRLVPGALVSIPHQFTTDAAGAAIVDPTYLRRITETCVDDILTHPLAPTIERVGMCTFVGNMLGLDFEGRPTTPLYTYADSRAHTALMDLQAHATSAHQRTGAPLHTAYRPAQLRWLQSKHPEWFGQVAEWTDIATYIYTTWFGRPVPCSYSIASWSGMFHRESLTWDADWLATLGLATHHLPPLADYDTQQRGLSDDYRTRWPILADVPFFLAVGDGAAANIGAGAVSPSQAALTVGTTAALRVVTKHQRTVPDGLWAYRVSMDHHLVGGATTEGGSTYAWVQKLFNLDEAAVAEALTSREPGAHGLTVLPLFRGERSPGYRGNATGTLHGLREATTPLDIAHALMEGVALRLIPIAEAVLPTDAHIAGTGGALKASLAWTQLIADALAHPIRMLKEPEITARGVAVLVSHGVTNETPPEVAQVVDPNPRRSAMLKALSARQRALYDRLYADA